MAKRLIDGNELLRYAKKMEQLALNRVRDTPTNSLCYTRYAAQYTERKEFRELIENAPTVDAVELPCKIGDYVWAIRNFNGHKHPQRGVVSDMYFTRDMQLNIVVKYVARGKWGETVFATDAEAYAVINGERKEG